MPSHKPRICVFGDSHFACVRAAVNNRAIVVDDADIEFWGNIGKRFRYLTWRNNRIEPMDAFTANRFAKVNIHERKVLQATDFDLILFVGCRIPLSKLFVELLHRRRTHGQKLSEGVEKRIIIDFLENLSPYQFAKKFAALDKAQIMLAPISFDIEGMENPTTQKFHNASNATKKDRDALWSLTESITKNHNIFLLPQNEVSVVKGCYTASKYAVKNYKERNDRTHKNQDYGALVLQSALQIMHKQKTVQTV